MTDNQRRIIKFYEELDSENPVVQPKLEALRNFVKLLFAERELNRCFFSTSHATLCISKFETHAERSDKPLLSVAAGGDNSVLLELRIESGRDVSSKSSYAYRSVTYACGCTVDRGLAEFDQLYERFIEENARLSE